jgi:uroporphyrinogen decarboxylase
MIKTMTKRERLAATIGGRPVDRLPVALWRHFFVEETSGEGLAAAMVRWQETYDWDFLKINPRASYHVEDWGNRYAFSGNPLVEPTLVRACVHAADDFRHLDRLDPKGKAGRSAPVLAEHLAAVAAIRRALGPDVPLLMTVFTPMSIAADLAGGPQDLAALIGQDPALVHTGLRTITETFAGFAARCLDAGADGIFLATTHCATPANFTLEQYQEFGRPYDLQVLAAVRRAPLNLLHVCRARSWVRQLADYPVALLNWDTSGEGNPTLAEMAASAPGKGLVGGLDRAHFTQAGGREALLAQGRETRRSMNGRAFVLGSTCTIDTASDPEAVRVVRECVEQPKKGSQDVQKR